VLPIWEGTTNVLSLDVWRAIERTGALTPWLRDARDRVRVARGAVPSDAPIGETAGRLDDALDRIERYVDETQDPVVREAGARRLAFAIARSAAGLALLEHAVWSLRAPACGRADVELAWRWARRGPARGLDAPSREPSAASA
jgi:hypothetical protein